MFHDGRVYPAVEHEGELLPEARAVGVYGLPHEHPQLDHFFPRALAGEEEKELEDLEEDLLEKAWSESLQRIQRGSDVSKKL